MPTKSATPARFIRANTVAWSVCLAVAHVGGFAANQEIVARRREEINHLGVFAEPCLVLRTSRNDHDVALPAEPLFRYQGGNPSRLSAGATVLGWFVRVPSTELRHGICRSGVLYFLIPARSHA